jgi:hypothetical protein
MILDMTKNPSSDSNFVRVEAALPIHFTDIAERGFT